MMQYEVSRNSDELWVRRLALFTHLLKCLYRLPASHLLEEDKPGKKLLAVKGFMVLSAVANHKGFVMHLDLMSGHKAIM